MSGRLLVVRLRKLPSLLIGARWCAVGDCYAWLDIDGREVRIFESEPFAMILATGERVDYIDWLAARRGVPRAEIVRTLQTAAAAEAPPVTASLGDHPYAGGGEAYASAGEFAQGRG